jgi:hypothetical protein
VEARATALLPAAAPVEDDWEDEPGRGYSLSLMALGLVLAAGLGGGIGALASRGDGPGPLAQQRELPLVTPAPVITVGPPVTPSSSPTVSPSPRVFLVTPSPTPTPSATATPTPTESQTTTEVVLDPSSGPMDTQITVTGQGWTPGAPIVVQFHNTFGDQAGATAEAVADDKGFFTTTLLAHDTQSTLPGPRTVSADDGTHHAEASFTVT